MEAAIAASKRSAEDEAARGKGTQGTEDDLAKAMRLSREEEEERQRRLAGSSGNGLFDNQAPQQQQQCVPSFPFIFTLASRTLLTFGLNRNNLIDIETPVQQPMQTGFASYNPYAMQIQQQQEEFMRQQVHGFSSNICKLTMLIVSSLSRPNRNYSNNSNIK